MAGGVAMNCVLNAYLRDKGAFKISGFSPAAGDAGTVLRGSMRIDLQERKSNERHFMMDHAYSDETIGPQIDSWQSPLILQPDLSSNF